MAYFDRYVVYAVEPVLTDDQVACITDDIYYKIRRQFAFYFSKENLANDAYLRSHMDENNWVPVEFFLQFLMISRITTDMNLIIAALSSSMDIELDKANMLIRPALKPREESKTDFVINGGNVEFFQLLEAVLALGEFLPVNYTIIEDVWTGTYTYRDDAQRALQYLMKWLSETDDPQPILVMKLEPTPGAASDSENHPATQGTDISSSTLNCDAPEFVPGQNWSG